MQKMLWVVFVALLFALPLLAQQQAKDSIQPQTLQGVVVRGYEQNRSIKDVAAPVTVLGIQQLQRSGTASILPAVNASPGVRMEERSPGSYRLSIRGSSLRSPFGVRNVKIYYNDIPFTDPGGNTYLNQFSFYNFSSIEILKGPGSSLYGAGTGGVMLINSFPETKTPEVSVNYLRGSYNANTLNVSALTGSGNFQSLLSYTRQNSDGYRVQTAMKREVLSWETKLRSSEKESLSTHVLYGDLYYQTPGALTLKEYLANPKAARPAAGGFPGAQQNQAAIYQKTFWAGLNNQYSFNEHWQNSSSVYGAFSQVLNPAVRNYERRLEPNFGARTTISFSTDLNGTALKLVGGGEFQQGYSTNKVYKNNLGRTDSLQTDDEVNNYQAALFLQAELIFKKGWILTGGVSLNKSAVKFNRLSTVPPFLFNSNYSNELAPRISLLKKLTAGLSVYGLLSRGFSPPTVSELLPSTSVINTGLQAEHGLNYELGLRGSFFNNRLTADLNAFDFRLQNAITQRRDLSGADYFVNAGTTKQRGLEASASYQFAGDSARFVTRAAVWMSYSLEHFRYSSFKQVNADYSGNRIPGIAPNTVSGGIDLVTRPGLYVSITYFYSDRIALDDANTAFASSYNLLGCKAGYRKNIGRHINADLFFSGDNLFNQTYSLGNDINAAAGRYYNSAPGVNYTAGISLHYLSRQ